MKKNSRKINTNKALCNYRKIKELIPALRGDGTALRINLNKI